MWQLLVLGFVASATAQEVGNIVPEVHSKLSWKRCKASGECQTVQGEVVVDLNWRWLHVENDYDSCTDQFGWSELACDSVESCTKCQAEGADDYGYKGTYGIITEGNKISMDYRTQWAFGSNENSRVFLMENEDKYQMFTLLNNEIAVDVDVSKVGCGVKASLYFVAMDADGGKSKQPTNLAGARYGTGYCDATCARGNRFVDGKANFEQWEVQYRTEGLGYYGACCAEFDVLNANNASYNMASKPCVDLDYTVCTVNECDLNMVLYPERGFPCDAFGCEYQPYRLGNTDFYGQHKTVDTTRNYTVVTRFEENKITQFFVQDGKRIDLPSPAKQGFPKDNGITEEYCNIKPSVFEEADRFNVVGGFDQHIAALKQPMVLTLTITDDYWAHNLWLDSKWPLDAAPGSGGERGPCSPEGNDPDETMWLQSRAKAVWSNIRFGPVGSTVKV